MNLCELTGDNGLEVKMTSRHVDVTISIVNTNNRDLLQSCLESVYDNTKRTHFEIIVVDNCSTDGSVEMIRDNFPEVRVLSNEFRKGYGFSQNRAFEESRGRYFLILNEDMIMLPHAIDIMMDRIKEDRSVGALGCRLLSTDHTPQRSCSNFESLFSEIYENLVPYNLIFPESRFRSELHHWSHNSEREVDVILGCCMLMPREAIEQIGLFDEQFVLFLDETDLCKRLRQAGWKVFFTPKAEMVHYYSETVKRMGRERLRTYLESKFRYFKKHHGKDQAYVIRITYLLGITLRIVGWAIVGIVRPGTRETAKEKLRVYWEVYPWFLGLRKV